MEEITLTARGKINLSLDILGKRPNGYHDVAMVMQMVHFADTVTVKKIKEDSITIQSDCKNLPKDERNIAYKAAKLMKDRFSITDGFHIYIQKRIPIAGGMAGGSTNAAAVLRAINSLCDLGLELDQLMDIGLSLGADVPFCVFENPSFAEGLGEILTPVCGLPDCDIVLVNPNAFISTKEIYQAIDEQGNFGQVENKKLINCLQDEDLAGATRYMKNIMQPVTEKKCSAISDIIKKLRELGAIHAMMSGSGATCYGIFQTGTVPPDLQSHFPGCFVEVTKPYTKSVI